MSTNEREHSFFITHFFSWKRLSVYLKQMVLKNSQMRYEEVNYDISSLRNLV